MEQNSESDFAVKNLNKKTLIHLSDNKFNNKTLTLPLDNKSDIKNPLGENSVIKTNKSMNKINKLYNSVFSNSNKQIHIIKPYLIVKESFIKTSSFNLDSNNTNSLLTTPASEKVINNDSKPLVSLGSSNSSGYTQELSPSSEGDSYNTTIIDIKVLLGVDSENKHSIILKDKNDSTSNNLISVLKNPDKIKVCYDRNHVDYKNCYNHKFIKFDFKNTLKSGTNNSVKEISFSINNEAIAKINNLDLIIESENYNRLPVKSKASFATGESFYTGDIKIFIPVPNELSSVSVISKYDSTNLIKNCENC